MNDSLKRPVVCHLIKGLGRGGAESLLPPLARCSENRYAYHCAYFLPWKDALVSELESSGVPVECFPSASTARMFLQIPTLVRWLKQNQVSLLHCHLPMAGVVGRIAGRLAGIPVVYTEHNVLERYHPWTRRSHLSLWRLLDHVVAVSGEVEASILRARLKGPTVGVIRNAIDVESMSENPGSRLATRGQLNVPEDSMLIGTVAVFRVQKRLELWLQAAKRLWEKQPSVRFVLVGDGPLRQELEEQVQESGLSQVVHFPGLQEDVRPWFHALDLYLMSSEFEGLPLALLEAMAAGLPIVATSVGGIPEAVTHQKEGLLVPFGDVPGLVQACQSLLESPELRVSLGQKAHQRARKEFGVKQMSQALEVLYDQVLGRRQAS